ncbi:MAG TPA: hypothetical protein V6C86_24225 [Oculatellaceae cyanobacterium]
MQDEQTKLPILPLERFVSDVSVEKNTIVMDSALKLRDWTCDAQARSGEVHLVFRPKLMTNGTIGEAMVKKVAREAGVSDTYAREALRVATACLLEPLVRLAYGNGGVFCLQMDVDPIPRSQCVAEYTIDVDRVRVALVRKQ